MYLQPRIPLCPPNYLALVRALYHVLVISALALPCAVGCAGGDPDGHVAGVESALTVTSDESGPATGPIIAVSVRANGDLVCTKSDGGPWTSAKGGLVEFYVRQGSGAWSKAGEQTYPPQPATGGTLMEISVPGYALTLPPGAGYAAECKALPYIDLSQDPNWTGDYCPNPDPTNANPIACTLSGVYDFTVEKDVPSQGPAGAMNCGSGKGESRGLEGCFHEEAPKQGTESHDFPCSEGHQYEVKLSSSSPSVVMTVLDALGDVQGTASTATKPAQRVSFSAPTTGACRVDIEADAGDTFVVQIRDEYGLAPAYKNWWTFIIDAGHGKIEPPGAPAWPESKCTDGNSYNKDDAMAQAERRDNIAMKAAVMAAYTKLPKFNHPSVAKSELIDYDAVILPWAAAVLSIREGQGVSVQDLRWRETQLPWCDGYRGYLMRLWARDTNRDPSRVAALQLHNNTEWKPGCTPEQPGCAKGVGSQMFHYGSNQGDPQWYAELRSSMTAISQPWLPNGETGDTDGDLHASDPHAAFVRGASGYTICKGGGTLTRESDLSASDCDDDAHVVEMCKGKPITLACSEPDASGVHISGFAKEYGAGLHAAALLEVAHYDLDKLYFAPPKGPKISTTQEFDALVGATISKALSDYAHIKH